MRKSAPPESALSFTVRDSINPYREAFLEGDITNPSTTAERKDTEIDIQKTLDGDLESYRHSGVSQWADALDAIRSDIRLTPEKRAIIG